MSQSTETGVAQNPYAAPVSDEPKPEAPTQLNLASDGQRIGTIVVDYFVVMFSAGFFLALVDGPDPAGPGKLLLYMYMAVYYLGFEAACGRTPGKMIMGTRVVTLDGELPSFWQCLGRTATRFVPFEPLSFIGAKAIGWHDKWSDTRVVRTR
jgi:uncharacterized RDD family membrane protein YckC